MSFPKYIEFEDGEIIIFPETLAHLAVAARVGKNPVSAGFVSAKRDTKGRFFGESLTLRMQANSQLSFDARAWFGATYDRLPVFSTARELLEALGASDIQAAPLMTEAGVSFPGTPTFRAAMLAIYFGM